MIPINQVPFLAKLKKIQNILRDDAKYDLISQNFYTSKEAKDLFDSFSKRVLDYYDDFDNLTKKTKSRKLFSSRSKLAKLAIKNDLFIYDNFDLPKFFKGEKEVLKALEALVYSPFSVNFFSKSLKDILNKYFIGAPIPEGGEINKITSQIGLSILENMKYCPPFLKRLFTEGYINGKEETSPTELFEGYIIEKMFENPYLFDILDFHQKITANKADLEKLKKAITGQFKIEGFFTVEPLTLISHELEPSSNTSKSSFSTMTITNLRDLLVKGEKIPDQISSELLNKEFIDQIQELVVTRSDKQQRRLFDSIQNQYNKCHKKKDKEAFLSFINEGLKTIEFEVRLIELTNLVNQTFFTLKSCLIMKKDRSLQNIDYKVYINDPRRFLREAENIFYQNNDDNKSFEDQIQVSSVQASICDPIFLIIVMLRGLTLDEFVDKRPGVKMANISYYNELEKYKNSEEIRFEPLIQMKTLDYDRFNRIASVYYAAFKTPNDPYNMLRGISKAYTFALNEMKMYMMNPDDDLDSFNISEDDEKKFILSLLYLVNIPNVYSTFIYLEEFLLSKEYQKSLLSRIKNSHFDMYNKIFPVMTHIGGKKNEDVIRSAIQFCMIYNKEVDLVLSNDDEDLNRLAHVIACGNQKDENIYKNTFINMKNKNITGNSEVKFSFRVTSVEYISVFVCNVTGFSKQKYDELPLNDLKSLEKFLNRKVVMDSLDDDDD